MTMEHIKRSFQVTLAIRHPSIDPNDISRAPALAPSRQAKAGQQRVAPTGELLNGTYQFSSWGHVFDTKAVEPFEVSCRQKNMLLVNELGKREAGFSALAA
jgi:hypothetical protein